jgi:membrane-bound metal-dependent hydrolase YbcI (DUF457 family)
MMGKTHAIGGVTALALYATASGNLAAVPAWAYGLAALSALVPDADNGGSAFIHAKLYLRPAEWLTYPVWARTHHRQRSHSLVGVATYVGLVWLYATLIALALSSATSQYHLPMAPILAAAGFGYASHLALDLLNMTGEQILWPLQVSFFVPPWHAHGFVPGRFHAGSGWEYWCVMAPMVLFLGWFMFSHPAALLDSVTKDHVLTDTISAALTLVGHVISLILAAVSK